MGCGCRESVTATKAGPARADHRLVYEVHGGTLAEPETFDRLGDARRRAATVGGAIRSKAEFTNQKGQG